MRLERKYHFDPSKFSKDSELLFSEYIQECEQAFYSEFMPYHANHLKGNRSVMVKIREAYMDDEDEYRFGLDDGLSIEESLKMDVYSDHLTVYAIGSFSDIDEPLFLMTDNALADGELILFYSPVDDEDDENDEVFPEDPEAKRKKTKVVVEKDNSV